MSTRWEAHGTFIYYPNNAGGFSLKNCPDPEVTAQHIVDCLNVFEGMPRDAVKGIGGAVHNNYYAHKALEQKVAALEHELQQQYHRGWLAGMEVESDRRRKLVGLLREATAYELGVTLRDDINCEIVEAEKLK